MSFLQMSFQGTVLILVILILRFLLMHKLPKKTFLLLWAVVLFRLLIPVSVPSALSVYSLLPGNIRMEEPLYVNESSSFEEAREDYGDMSEETFPEPNIFVSPWKVIWAMGFLLISGFFLIAYLRGLRKFGNSFEVENSFIREWKEKHFLRRGLSIRSSDNIAAPLSYGLFKPVILLPSGFDFDDIRALNYILTHEYVHIRRFDILTKALMMFGLSIHWFNPMVWIMFLVLNRDIELACDETVVRIFGEKEKSAYARTLIDMEVKKAKFLPLCNSFSKNAVEERIGAIMKTEKITMFSLIMAGVIIGAVTTTFATNAVNFSGDKLDQILGSGEYSEDVVASYYGDGEFETLAKELCDKVEWWTYNEYKDWLEKEKVQLQDMLGEQSENLSRGKFTWTQEIIDETIALYEETLRDIKNGLKVSKSIEGHPDEMMVMNPLDMQKGMSERALSLSVKLKDGATKDFGPFSAAEEMLKAVKPFCEEQLKLGNMTQKDFDEIITAYSE